MIQRENISNGRAINLDFVARGITIANPTGMWVYVRVGANDAPNQNNASFVVSPYTTKTERISARAFGFGLSFASGANVPTAGDIRAVFVDTDTQPATATINQPQVSFVPAWVYTEPSLGIGAVATLINPGASARVQLFKIRYVADPTIGAQAIYVYHSVAPDIVTLQAWSTGGAKLDDELDLLPHGFLLPLGATLKIQNAGASSIQPGIGVLYSIV